MAMEHSWANKMSIKARRVVLTFFTNSDSVSAQEMTGKFEIRNSNLEKNRNKIPNHKSARRAGGSARRGGTMPSPNAQDDRTSAVVRAKARQQSRIFCQRVETTRSTFDKPIRCPQRIDKARVAELIPFAQLLRKRLLSSKVPRADIYQLIIINRGPVNPIPGVAAA